MNKMEKYLVRVGASVQTVLLRQEMYKLKTILVVDADGRALGTISDGDLRRYLLKHYKPPSDLSEIMQTNFFHVFETENIEKRVLAFDLSKGVVPIVDKDMVIVDVYDGQRRVIEPMINVIKSFTSIAPVRISFAGGGSDIASWFKKHNGKCINAAIDTYARVNFELRDDNNFHIKSVNTKEDMLLSRQELFEVESKNLVLNCLRKFPDLPNVNVTIYCDFPPGSGLGGSSSLCVALLQGCAKLTGAYFTKVEIQSMAYEIERFDTGILGGWQDQIATVLGGLIISTFRTDGIKSTKIYLSESEQEALNSSLFLFKIGKSRSSSKVQRLINSDRGTNKFHKNMLEILTITEEVENSLREGNFRKIGYFLDKGWQAKRKLSAAVSNSAVDTLYEKLMTFGADGGRLLGAGRAGYLMMFVDLSKQGEFINRCSIEGFDFQRFKLDMLGARIIGERK